MFHRTSNQVMSPRCLEDGKRTGGSYREYRGNCLCYKKGYFIRSTFTLPAQLCELQDWYCLRAGQGLPPHAGCRVIDPWRYWVPPPQDREQLDHGRHVTAQCTLEHLLRRRRLLHPSVWSIVINEKSRANHSNRGILISVDNRRAQQLENEIIFEIKAKRGQYTPSMVVNHTRDNKNQLAATSKTIMLTNRYVPRVDNYQP